MGLRRGIPNQVDERNREIERADRAERVIPVNPGLRVDLTEIRVDQSTASIPSIDLSLEYEFTIEFEDGTTTTVHAFNADEAKGKASAAYGKKVKSVTPA